MYSSVVMRENSALFRGSTSFTLSDYLWLERTLPDRKGSSYLRAKPVVHITGAPLHWTLNGLAITGVEISKRFADTAISRAPL
jgi:hypothetical protein